MGTRETSHRAEPYRISHRLLSDASPSRQHAERGVNPPPGSSSEVLVSLSIPEPRPVGRSLRGIGLVSGSPGWPNLARHFPAGRALVSDKTRLNSERRDPHDLLHRGAAAGAGNFTSSFRNVRHRTHPKTYYFYVNSPPIQWFPFAPETFAHTISHADQALLARPQV